MTSNDSALNPSERRAIVSLAAIFALRMLGLFLVLPLLAVFARDMPGSTPTLAGLALGIYGLTQAILQIPFGYFSDRVGRKTAITVGLFVFAAGSVLAANADTIFGVIAGRALQGSGAIAAAVLALAADLTREQQRTKATASIGVSIGFAFLVALMLAPVLEGWIGVSGIFWVTAALAIAVLPVLWWWTPDPVRLKHHADTAFDGRMLVRAIRDPQLLRLDAGIFALHLALTSLFVVVPLQLVDVAGMPASGHWKIYVPVLLASVVGMLPLLLAAHRYHRHRGVMAVSIVLMVVAEALLGVLGTSLVPLVAGMLLFFIGFNTLEAILPSLTSRLAPAGAKGTVLGVYNTFEFLGIFIGGLAGGWLHGRHGPDGVYLLAAAALGVWLLLVLRAPPLRLLNSITLRLVDGLPATGGREILARLHAIPGVEDGTVVATEGLVYLKVDPDRFRADSIDGIPELVRS